MDYKSLSENALLGIGHPILDLLVHVDDDFLRKHNLTRNKTVLATEEHLPLMKDIIENHDPIYLIGGCVHNALFVTQWILEKPKIATFIGCIGDDEYAEKLEKRVSKVGIDVRFEKLQCKTTSFCLVLITGNNRTLVTNIGTSNFYSEEHVEKIWPCVEKAQFFYIMGFSLAKDFDFTMKIAKHSHENNKTLTMNLSAEYICKKYSNKFMEIFPYIDIIIGNEQEALAIAESFNLKSSDLKDLCLEISNLPKNNKKNRVCIITRSEKPIICASGEVVKEFPVLTLPSQNIVDTNGAGDAFVGGFLAQLISGQDIDECVKCGLYASSVSLQHIGCNFNDKSKYTYV